MLDESKYPTLRYFRCRTCGHVFVEGLAGSTECPECSSSDAGAYRPGSDEDSREEQGSQQEG